jgi:hypothetical protein
VQTARPNDSSASPPDYAVLCNKASPPARVLGAAVVAVMVGQLADARDKPQREFRTGFLMPVGVTPGARSVCRFTWNGGRLEHAQQMAAHESPRTTKLYDRTRDEITVGEVERLHILTVETALQLLRNNACKQLRVSYVHRPVRLACKLARMFWFVRSNCRGVTDTRPRLMANVSDPGASSRAERRKLSQ